LRIQVVANTRAGDVGAVAPELIPSLRGRLNEQSAKAVFAQLSPRTHSPFPSARRADPVTVSPLRDGR
jgi:hypothetical protein